MTVGINIYKSAPATELISSGPSGFPDICESAIAVVPIEDIWTVVCHIEIRKPVVIVITDTTA